MSFPEKFCRTLLLLWLTGPAAATAGLELPSVFDDDMVLQRNQPVRVWGTADPSAVVEVSFRGIREETVAGKDGQWSLSLDPMPASSDPAMLSVSSSGKTVRFRNVLVGEVWICSGQSNMEKPLGEKKGQRPTLDYREALQTADFPLIRLYQVPHYGEVHRPRWEKNWLVCSPEALEESRFSAVGYYFARKLHLEAGVPVGMIQATYGGTMIETWMPEQAFSGDPVLEPLLHRRYFSWVEGVQATDLFHSMVEQLVPYSVNGFLWYQGEANAMYAESTVYTRKLRSLIEAWRHKWQQPDAPFLYVQLAPFNYSEWDKFPRQMTPLALPLFWEAQAAALAIPHTGMVVTTDLAGDARDIHPVRKREVGERLAGLARGWTGQELPNARSPLPASARIQGQDIVIDFHYAASGLSSRDGEAIGGFEIAGPDRLFHPASAVVSGDQVRLHSTEVKDPVAVRFAWHETADPNLVNSRGLPVTPFRTDNWPIKNEKDTAP